MPGQRPSRVIIDTNVWISFLIGKELQSLKDLIVTERVKLITCDQLILELRIVTSRAEFQKYFGHDKVSELLSLLDIVSDKIKIRKIESICRDAKDNFLLALSRESKADFLITGDKDLLEIGVYCKTEILTVKRFKEKVQ